MAEEDRRDKYDDNGNTIYQAEFVDKVMMEDAIKAAYQYMMATAMKYSYFAHSGTYSSLSLSTLQKLDDATDTKLKKEWTDGNNNIGLGYYIEKAMIERAITDNVHTDVANLKKLAGYYAEYGADNSFNGGHYSALHYASKAESSANSASASAKTATEKATAAAKSAEEAAAAASSNALAELLTSGSSIKNKTIKIGNSNKQVYPTLKIVVRETLQDAAGGSANDSIETLIKKLAGTNNSQEEQ